MNNLKKFETEAEYQAWKDGDDYVFPNICKVGEEVVYNNYPDPFWIEALEDVTVKFHDGSGPIGEYSFDKKIWSAWESSGVTLRTGKRLYIRHTIHFYPRVVVSGRYNAGGSVLSLFYGSEYLKNTTHLVGRLRQLFAESKKIVSAKELVLATVYQQESGMYQELFKDCTLLKEPPKLPATLSPSCYRSMFYGCTSLTTAPSLLASKDTGVPRGWYREIYAGCSNLSYIKMLSPIQFDYSDTTSAWSRDWVSGVAATGTFIANAKRTDFTRGVHGIPVGWDLYLYDEDNDRYVVKFTVNNIPYEFYTDKPRSVQWDEFCRSEHNTNGFTYPIGASRGPVKSGSDFILLGGNNVMEDDKIVLNASYTIGQPTATTEE